MQGKYVRKEVVEAIQFKGNNMQEVLDFMKNPPHELYSEGFYVEAMGRTNHFPLYVAFKSYVVWLEDGTYVAYGEDAFEREFQPYEDEWY